MKNVEKWIKNIPLFSVKEWLMGFGAILFIRFFLEAISSDTASGIIASDISTIVHYILFYVAAVLSMYFLFYIILPRKRNKIPSLLLCGLLAVWMAPIFDLILSGGRGYTMAYLFQDIPTLIQSYVTFFGEWYIPGATPGVRLEIGLIMLGVFFAIISMTDSIKKALIASLGVYTIVFFWGSLPSIFFALASLFDHEYIGTILDWFVLTSDNSLLVHNSIHPTLFFVDSARHNEIYFNIAISHIYYLALTLGIVFAGLLHAPKKIGAILKNIRVERLGHYWLMTALGLLIAHFGNSGSLFAMNIFTLTSIVILFIVFLCAWTAAVGVNDIEDIAVDEISNKARPIVSGIVTNEEQKGLNTFIIIWGLVGAFLISHYVLFLFITFLSLSYVYSVPPLKLRRIPILSTFLIGLASLTAAMSGFFLLSADKSVEAFPVKWVAAIVLGFTFSAIIKDFKDIEGDGKVGNITLPVWIGKRRAQLILAPIISSFYLFVPALIHQSTVWIAAIPFSVITYLYMIQKNFNEKYIFRLYFAFVICTALLLLIL